MRHSYRRQAPFAVAQQHLSSQAAVTGAVLAATLAGMLITAGCSTHAPAPKSVNGTHEPQAAAISFTDPPVDPITAALVPKAIRVKGSITVAMDAAYPPDEFIGPDGHTIVGMDADLGKLLGDEMGIRWNLLNAPLNTIMLGLQSGKFDVGLSSFRDTLAHPKRIVFVTYFKAGESFYVRARATSAITSLASLCGKRVAVAGGTVEQADAARLSKRCTASGEPAVHVKVYSSQDKVKLAVASGQASAGFADSQAASYVVKQSAGAFKLSGPAINVVRYAIAVPKANGMAEAILAALTALTVDGLYTRILAKWGMASGAITNPVISGAKS
jgi:polar amino acid transport system substrate-binding protein